MSTGKILLGVLAGVAAGALLGVLFAPDKGKVTRKKLAGKADDYADGLREKFNEYMDTISEKIEDVNSEEYADSLKEKFEEFLDSITEKFDTSKEEVDDFAENKKSKSHKTKSETKTAMG